MCNAYKKWLSMLLVAASLSLGLGLPTAFAAETVQQAEIKADIAERQKAFMNEATKRLQLTDAQRPEFERIVKHDAQQKQAALSKHKPESLKQKRALRAEIQEIDASTDSQLSKVLNDNQMDEYKLMREENRKKAKEAMEKQRHAK